MKNYQPVQPTKTQLVCEVIRDMFFTKHYNGVIPVKDIEIVKNSNSWRKLYTKKAVLEAIKELETERYMNLDEKKENFVWGLPETHEDLFKK